MRWHEHVRRINQNRMVKRIYESECNGRRKIGQLRRRRMGNVRGSIRERGLIERRADEVAWRSALEEFCEEASRGFVSGDET